MFIKDKNNEFYTKDEAFYEKITGIKNIHRFVGKTNEEMNAEVNRFEHNIELSE